MKHLTAARTLALASAVAVAASTAGALPALAQEDSPVVLSDGHVDAFEVSLDDDDELQLMIKDDTVSGQTSFHDPADVILQAVPESAWEVPDWVADFPEFAFLGEPGDLVYRLQDTQQPGLLWPGSNTERLNAADFDGDVELAITHVDGPGAVKLYTINDFGLLGTLMVDSANDDVDDRWEAFVGSHAHFNWLFTAEGTYTITAQASATLTDGTEVSTGGVEYTFVVGDLPDPGDPADVSQLLIATLDELDGALVVSVDPDDREVRLPALELASDGASWLTTGELRPVTVTDTRADAPGWTTSAQVSDFAADDDAGFASSYLGWSPTVLDQGDGPNVEPGNTVEPGFPTGDGLSVSRILASAAAGEGTGTAHLGAGLTLRVPTDTRTGTYEATLTFTSM